jgi:oxygen-independent coproporphyrinogen-3 oxidase
MEHTYTKYGGIYAHIPFCVQKCPYCDFYSITDQSLKPRYLKALIGEMQMIDSGPMVFDTLYLGGGTPSVCGPADIGQIIDTAAAKYNIASNTEVTLEVNPGTVTLESLKVYREIGINRLNIGVQSFREANLAFLRRIHSARDATAALEWAQQSGFDNIGIDLIYGLPNQAPEQWRTDLEQALEFKPQHVSCYMLTCEPGTPLHGDLQAGLYKPLSDVNNRDLFDLTVEILENVGYLHYEISNFALQSKSGSLPHISRHNIKYWTFAPYLGFGASAHTFIEPRRRWNVSNVNKYISKIETGHLPIEETEDLTREQLLMETIYLGLRTCAGIDLRKFNQKFGLDLLNICKEVVADLENEDQIIVDERSLRLTRKGMFFLDAITSMFTSREFELP